MVSVTKFHFNRNRDVTKQKELPLHSAFVDTRPVLTETGDPAGRTGLGHPSATTSDRKQHKASEKRLKIEYAFKNGHKQVKKPTHCQQNICLLLGLNDINLKKRKSRKQWLERLPYFHDQNRYCPARSHNHKTGRKPRGRPVIIQSKSMTTVLLLQAVVPT